MDIDDTASAAATADGGRSRRSFVTRAGLAGLALAAGDVLLPGRLLRAGAQEEGGDEEPAAPEVTEADLLAFLRDFELMLVALYERAAAAGAVTSPEGNQLLTTFAAHHQAHADAVRGASTIDTGLADLQATLEEQFNARETEESVLELLHNIENGAAATHLGLAGLLDDRSVDLVASILPVEAQHATYIGGLLDRSVEAVLPAFQTEEGKADAVAVINTAAVASEEQ